MSKGDFRRALLDADRELAQVPYSGERDVHALVGRRRRIAWRVPALALATAVALLVWMQLRERAPVEIAGLRIDAPASSWQAHGSTVEVLAPSVDVDVADFGHVTAVRGARVARIDGGIHVERGRVDVAVTHRRAGAAPALVRVSHGTIAVLGTRFTIEQRDDGGRVVLHEGKIRFDADGRSVMLAPGDSLSWPLAPVTTAAAPAISAAPPAAAAPSAPASAAPAPTSPADAVRAPVREPAGPSSSETSAPAPAPLAAAPASPELEVDRILADLSRLRARRRFADAAAMLEQALASGLPSTTLERLSYELGDIRTHQLADPERACRHWQSHRARFPQGRYTDEVAAAVRRLRCQETTP